MRIILFGQFARFAANSHNVSNIIHKTSILRNNRSFHTSITNYQSKKASLFGELTTEDTNKNDQSIVDKFADRIDNYAQSGSQAEDSLDDTKDDELRKLKATLKPETDEALQKFYAEKYKPFIATEELLLPLKREVFKANVEINGFYKNDFPVILKDGKQYCLNLKKEEIEALEPSIYLKSFRLKSSTKKANLVVRLLRLLPLKEAIKQCHFSHKKVAVDVGELLESGIKKAEIIGLDPNELYISQIWTGDDGNRQKRIEFKGRGRTGIIEHKYVHVRLILRGKQTKLRLQHEKEKKLEKRQVEDILPNYSLGRIEPVFKW